MDRIPLSVLRQLGLQICSAFQIPVKHSEILIDALMDADLSGKSTHGLMRLAPYLERVQLGLLDVHAAPVITHDAGALINANAQNGFGAVALDWAIQLLKSRAKQHGIAAVILDHSNHVGALGYWTRSLAMGPSPLVSLIISDASPRLPPSGGVDPVLGNNPWSLGIPWATDRAITLDMANSVAAAGKVRKAMLEGVDIPDGWALDKDGRSTNDPHEALSGLLLPMAGYKGYAITLMMAMMTSVLGQAESIDVRNVYDLRGPQNLSQFAMAIDMNALYGKTGSEQVQEKIEQWVLRIKSGRRQEGVEEIWLPGEQSEARRSEGHKCGAYLDPATIASLNELADSIGVKGL